MSIPKFEEIIAEVDAEMATGANPPAFAVITGRAADMFEAARDEALIIQALMLLLHDMAENGFTGQWAEAMVLLAESRSRVEGLVDELKLAHAHFDQVEAAND